MDVDVVRYASEYAETGDYGSEIKLSAGVSFSPKTKLFYPQEGIGIVVPLMVFVHLSDIISPDSQFVLYSFNQVFSALSVLMIFMIFSLYMTKRKALLYTALFGLGTPLFVHSKYFLPEPLTLLSIISSVYFILKFRREKKSLYIFFSALSAGYSLLTRPDAPIFAGVFIVMAFYFIIQQDKKQIIKNASFLVLGFSIFAAVFIVSNYQRYGSLLETGYTLDRNEVKVSLEAEIPLTYEKAAAAYQADQNSKETSLLVQQFQSQQKYLEDLNKVINEYGDGNTAFYSSGAVNFLHGVYLILFSPNRSVFILSPFLLLLLFSLRKYFKQYKVSFIITGSIFAGYLVLYALRAPLSYAGSAAWGIRYMLPVYPILFLSVIFFDRSEILKNKVFRNIFYALCAISILFQIIGSSVNYQSVQMPVEYKSKKIHGDKDMTWAQESRKSMMTDFSSSLLLNNARIMAGVLTPEQKEYGVDTGPNDWFFYQVLKGEGRLVQGKERSLGDFKLIMFLLLLTIAGTAFYLFRNLPTQETKK
ncbi:MAG: hypothetical protein A2Y39_05560 [Candidatus Delongbacteria bacterium GWF2_40_14]|nr:MAG: hypothetical protein A2Y39_05560 [Candidatus Delongbacteria bacterium GWF2_40_14]